jgi:hypothetical protein
MTRANATATAVNSLSIAALLLACCSFGTSTASAAITCMSEPGKTGYHAWRTIDGRKCWFQKVGTTNPAKSELRWATKRDEPEERSTALGYSPDESLQPRTALPPVATATPSATAPRTSEAAPLRYRIARVRPATEPPAPVQTSLDLMNGSSLSSHAPAHLAPAAPFSDRFSGGKD